MNSRFFLFVFSFTLLSAFLSGCKTNIDPTPQREEVGASGLIVIEKGKIPFQLDDNVQVEVFPDFMFSVENTKDAILLISFEDLVLGEEFEIRIHNQKEEFVFNMIVRKPCLTYLAEVTTSPEIWQLCGKEFKVLTQTSGRIVDYAVAKNGDWIVYSNRNDEGGTDIWKVSRNGENHEFLLSCGEKVCEQLAINSQGSKIAYKSSGVEESLYILAIENSESILVEKGNVSNIDFSPNDNLLRYFENSKGFIRVLDLTDLKLIKTLESDSDLIGSWKKDSSGFMFGQHNYWGGIAGINLLETNLLEDIESLIINGNDTSAYLYQPTYLNDEELFVLYKMGFNANRKQIWVINRNGEKIFELTSEYQYSHSMISWNSVEEKLIFQRFDHASSGSTPEVWVWDKKENIFQIIEKNAAHAEWVF
ncbi:MAG: hypothetical protein Q7J07_00665 [Pelolinea sp.]|nr:hypothetical protein [Pelolinea sp.]